jgi:membrane associated rhomboid family serine protease
MAKNKGSKDPSSRQPTTVREDAVEEEEETDYQQLEELPSSPSSALSETSSTSTFGRWKNQYWKRSASRSKEHQSIASGGSFSQSEDFQKLFDDEENPKEKSASEESEEIYLVKQKYGYCAIGFSVGQLLVLIAMMVGCGIAPMNINPMIGPYPDALSYWGGKNAVNIIDDGEWWRLITPIMLHAGVIHLICNVAVQIETGAFFEREWGSTKWLIIYMVSAVGSSALSVIKMPGAISVGSSGAVMGLFGAKLAEVIVRFCDRDKSTQGRIAHQVRKEQATGVTCSVIVVMLFSFIPFGKKAKEKKTKQNKEKIPNPRHPNSHISFLLLKLNHSGLGGSHGWSCCWLLHWSGLICSGTSEIGVENCVVGHWGGHHGHLFFCYLYRNVFRECGST